MSTDNKASDEISKTPAVTERFTRLSDQAFLLPAPASHLDDRGRGRQAGSGPDLILIYGWGDGRLNHVAKFADGFRILFPKAKIIVVLAPIFKALFSGQENRVKCIKPVIAEGFPPDSPHLTSANEPSVLVHVLSNTGLLYFTATLEGYKRTFGHPMPHKLLVMDSAPGNMDHDTSNIGKLADAMAVDARSRGPWPPQVTKAICIFLLYFFRAVELARSRENPIVVSTEVVNDEAFATKSARRIYIYSKEDLITAWQSVEKHAGEAEQRGYEVKRNLSEESGHVEHMRRWPERYWRLMGTAWGEAISDTVAPKARL